MRVVMTVKLEHPVTGKQIMDAIQELNATDVRFGNHGELVEVIDEDYFYEFGRTSRFSHEELVIAVGETYVNTYICPKFTYSMVAVVNHEWGDSRMKAGGSTTAMITSLKAYRDLLQEKLS